MSSIVISGDTSGAITLAAPSVAGTNTATLPAAAGTVMVSGNMPSFRAHQSASSSLTSTTFTLVPINTKDWDTANNFNTSTYTFTPTVAGYYQINATINVIGTAITRFILAFFKNGSQYSRPTDLAYSTTLAYYSGSDMVYMNGTTDYLQLYVYAIGTGLQLYVPALNEWPTFSASLVRTS